MSKKKNPQDATLRNVNARKKEIAKLELSLKQVRKEFIRQRKALIHIANTTNDQIILDILNEK